MRNIVLRNNPDPHNKRFTFVNLSIDCGSNTGINHGIAYLVPVLKKRGYYVSLINLRDDIGLEEFIRCVDDTSPSIVGFSSTSNQLKYLIKYSGALAVRDNILLIAGGVHATLDPENILNNTCIDGACIGEGELPLSSLADNIISGGDISSVDGFYWRRGDRLIKNEIVSFPADLSLLDYPDYTVFSRECVVTARNYVHVMLSRGCPYACTYCCNDAIKNIYKVSDDYFRVPSVEHSIGMLRYIIDQYDNVGFIEFEDDLLIANKKWFAEFSKEYSKKIGLPYRICARVECISSDIVSMLASSGCKRVLVGVESGNEALRRDRLNRNHSNQLILDKCGMIKKAGMELFSFNIVGYPYETASEMKDTYNLNRLIAPDSGVCSIFYPYVGTKLYELCKTNDLLRDDDELLDISNYFTKPAICMNKETEEACIKYRNKMMAYFNRRKAKHRYRIFSENHSILTSVIYYLAIYMWYGLIKKCLSQDKTARLFDLLRENAVVRKYLLLGNW